MTSALHGIRIVDLTQHLAGPFCTMLLADMGAEVIKVEPPWGDASRSSPQYPSVEGQNSYYMFVNRNKKSIVLDLKRDGRRGAWDDRGEAAPAGVHVPNRRHRS